MSTNQIDPFNLPDMREQGETLNEEQSKKRQDLDMLYIKVFGSPEGKAVLADLTKRMEEEDSPMFNIQHVNELMMYSSGRRSIVKYIQKRMDRILKG